MNVRIIVAFALAIGLITACSESSDKKSIQNNLIEQDHTETVIDKWVMVEMGQNYGFIVYQLPDGQVLLRECSVTVFNALNVGARMKMTNHPS